MVASREALLENFAKPEGYIGEFLGDYMLHENYELNVWAAKVINAQKHDHILEIGFGPGIAIQELSKLVPDGRVVGIDYSDLMVVKAKKLNAEAIQKGQVKLLSGSVENLSLSLGEEQFDKIVAVNTAMYWKDTIQTMSKILGHLKPGGTLSIILHRADQSVRDGSCQDEIKWYSDNLYYAGFGSVYVQSQTLPRTKREFISSRKTVQEILWGYDGGEYDLAGICITATKSSTPHLYDATKLYLNVDNRFGIARSITLT
ncbi:MAG: class I SAM-dependent methyltransferase [Cyanobacteria bacterium]|nr:class I SAM-dependent methyltransferase [Cyanobacteriota bacterium]